MIKKHERKDLVCIDPQLAKIQIGNRKVVNKIKYKEIPSTPKGKLNIVRYWKLVVELSKFNQRHKEIKNPKQEEEKAYKESE